MIALDYELDTSTAAGELAAGALIEIGDWQRGRIARRTRPGLTAMHTPAPTPSAPRSATTPQLSARISAMRAQGMSLQAISDTLNAEARPHAARRHPLAALQRPGRHRLQAPAHQTRRHRTPTARAHQHRTHLG